MYLSKIVTTALSALLLVSCTTRADAQQHDGAGWGKAAQSGLRVMTVGTGGGPPPRVDRGQPATLILVDDRKYLVDAGDGTGFSLMQAGVRASHLDGIFVTHLHWDHVLGLDYIFGTAWMTGKTDPVPVFGPPGLDFFMSRLISTIEVGEDIFAVQADPRPPIRSLFLSREVDVCEPEKIFEDDLVTVTTVCTSHFDHVFSREQNYGQDRSLAYRFDTPYGSVTVTGDTGPSASVEELAAGSDMLVAEIVDLESMGRLLNIIQPDADHSVLLSHLALQHLTAEEVGKMASESDVGSVVLTHLILGPGFDPSQFSKQVSEFYDGPVFVGEDLKTFEVFGN